MRKLSKCLLLALTMMASSFTGFSQTDIAKVRALYLSSYTFGTKYKISASAAPMSYILNRIGSDGSFNRRNKACTPADLTDTIFKMTYVYLRPDSTAYYQDTTVRRKLYNALNYWLNHYPTYTWTTSAMDQPTSLGMILAKLYNNFQTDGSNPSFSSLITNIKLRSAGFVRYSWSAGATKTTFINPDLGDVPSDNAHRIANTGYRIFGYTGIITANDDSTSMDTLSTIFSNQFALRINKLQDTTTSAMLYDGSLFQHGTQTYNIGYGTDWLSTISDFGAWTKTSKWKLTSAQQQTWANILLNGLQWMAHQNFVPHNIIGRHNAKKGSAKITLKNYVNSALSVCDATLPQRPQLLALQTNLNNSSYYLDSTKYLWNSHLILNHSSKYFASVKMLSARVTGTESSDASGGEGIMNFHIADGSTMIYRKGTEYDNARVGWNWRCIPGATIKQKTGALPLVPWSIGYTSNNIIAGGVSDGAVSMGVFSLNRTSNYDKTRANKAYFAFKDILLCLGNTITDADAASGNIYTTINQCERLTDIYYNINGGTEQSVTLASSFNSTLSITSPSWFWQDSIGYIVIPKSTVATKLLMQAQTRSGDWHNLDTGNPSGTVSVNIFQLSIDHGSGTTWNDTTYRYVVVPSVSKADLITFFNNKVIGHDSTSLYINYNNNRIISASYNGYTGVFFLGSNNSKATKLGADSLSISTNSYAAVLAKRVNGGMYFHVSDIRNAFYSNNLLRIGVNRVFHANSFAPPRSVATCTVVPAIDTTLITLSTSKTQVGGISVYEGEPVDVNAAYAKVASVSNQTIADSYVQDGTYAGTNFGTSVYLVAKNDGTGYQRQVYLKFDLHGIQGNVLKASLQLYSQGAYATTWQLWKVNNNTWTETGITWNNAPAPDTLMSTASGTAGAGYVTWDITNQLKHISADSLLSFKVISTASGVYTSFASKETATSNQRPVIIFSADTSKNASLSLMSLKALNTNDTIAAKPTSRPAASSDSVKSKPIVSAVSVMVYPNPVINRCTVQADQPITGVAVYNMMGRLIKKAININSDTYGVDLTGLMPGEYVFVITTVNGRTSKKVLKID